MQEDREASPRKLEDLVDEQNILVERLRTELKNERAKVDSLNNQCLHNYEDVEELKRLKELLINNGIKEVSQNSFDTFKVNIEQELSRCFNKTLNNVKSNHQKEIERLELHHQEELNCLRERSCLDSNRLISEIKALKLNQKKIETLELHHQEELNSLREQSYLDNNRLTCEIKALDDSLSHFKQTTQALGDIALPSHQELLTSSLNKLNRISLELSPIMTNIRNFLVQSIEREISLTKELVSFKTTSTVPDEECQGDISEIDDSKFVPIEHSLNVCNHDKEICASLHEEPACSKLETILRESENKLNASIPSEIDNLHSYTCKLKKYMYDMVNFYKCRLNKLIKSEFDVPYLGWPPGKIDEVCIDLKPTLPLSGKLMKDIKECHRMMLCLNVVLRSLDHNLNEALQKNKQLDEDIVKLKQSNTEKVLALESHTKLLNEKILICLGENKSLESALSDLRSTTITKIQFDLLSEEKDRLADLVMKLEGEVESLKNINIHFESMNKNMQGDSCLINRTRSVGNDETLTFPDGSINYENLLPMNAITSTPFPTKKYKSEVQGNHELLKSSLMEWIERCHALESEKKQLERKLFNLNFTFNQATLGNNILEQELVIVKSNVKNLENKLGNYITLKETCHVLESDNSVLNIKIKFLTDLINDSKVEHVSDCVPNDISEMDKNVFKSLEPNLHGSAFNFINEFQKKNQKLILLESKCRSKDSIVGELTIKLNQAQEMERLLLNKIENLIDDNNQINEKLYSMIDENAQANFDKKMLNIELKSVKDQLNHLISSGDTFKDSGSSELIEAMKRDALKFLKESIDKWSKVELKSVEISPAQIDRLDARHQVEILMKSNNQLKNEKEDLLQKILQLKHEFHSLQKQSDCVEAGWYVKIDKFESDFIKELKEQREQHARIEEALRSTGKLHDALQNQLNLHRGKLQEISLLKKMLEDEKTKNKCSEAQIVILKDELNEKEKMLLRTIEDKKAYANKIISLEKEFALKEKLHQRDLLRIKWASQFNMNKYSDFKVKKELANFQNEVNLQESEKEKSRFTSMETVYQHSIDSLRFCLQRDKAQSLASTSEKHQAKVVR